jgi:hypothetical protein
MADYAVDPKPKAKKAKTDDHKDILEQARSDYDRAYEKEKHNIDLAYDDLKFLAGDEYAQWDEAARAARLDQSRPVLQVNRLPQFVHQITGDIRQMKPSIKVVPVDSGADEKVANLMGGLIRYIENRSDASAIYFRTADSQVGCGIGHWRVATEYADSSTFNQELRIDPIEDGIAVLWDSDAIRPSKDDANYCFVPVDMSRKAFEKKYPDVSPADFDNTSWGQNSVWCTDDYVRVAEYWVKKPTKKTLALAIDGSISDVTDADESALAFHQSKGSRIEERDSTKICRYLITAAAVLEGPEDWPGRHIPIVPVVGEEIRIGRGIIRKGIVRDAKDPQRMVNYYESAQTEVIALQPKAPFMVTELNVAKYSDRWETANTENQPYLIFTPDPANGGQAPQRMPPPVSSQGINDGLARAHENLKGVIGIYDAGLGNKSNETSGKAIIARQREGDVGSYLYVDNFARAVRRTGDIIIDLIPKVYDTERTIRIMGEDGKVDVLEVNKAQGTDPATGKTIYEHDLTVGSYDVVATVGPSYTTRREEAKEGMTAFVQAAPQTAPLILDLVAKAQDWPMADDIAKRIRATMPPHLVQMEEMEKQGASPEQIQQFMAEQRQNQPPDPKTMKMQADLQLQQQNQQFQQAKAAADGELEQQRMAVDQQNKEADRQLEMAKLAEQARMKEAELAQQAAIEQAKLAQSAQLERERMELDARVRIQIAEINAHAKAHDSVVRAETAKYATDNRPNGAAQ